MPHHFARGSKDLRSLPTNHLPPMPTFYPPQLRLVHCRWGRVGQAASPAVRTRRPPDKPFGRSGGRLIAARRHARP